MTTTASKSTSSQTLGDGAAEEFNAALEAATGEEPPCTWSDPMDGEATKSAFDCLLLTRRPDRGLDALARAGLMQAVLPEVAALVGFGEGVRHKDVWDHTKKVVIGTPARLDLRWAALLHDIGKVPTRRFEPDGQVTFISHPEVGARMFKKLCRRLPFSKPSYERIALLIASHLRASAYDETWTDSAVRRFGREMGEAFFDLLDLCRADITSKYAEKVRRGHRQIDLLAERALRIQAEDAKPAPLPKGLGTVICNHFGLAPSPLLGQIMRHLTLAVEEGQLQVQAEHQHYVEYLMQRPEMLREAKKK